MIDRMIEPAGRVARRSAWLGTTYARGVPGRSRYALTFDDGPLCGSTEQVLDILKSFNARATFFVIGRNARANPALIERMAGEGHVVGNHTWSHSRLSMMRGPVYWRREIEQTDALLRSILGKRPRLFRPPMGILTPINAGVVRRTGHACVLWSRRAMDGVNTTRERIVERLTCGTEDGGVLLMHDGREPASRRDPKPTIDALPDVLRAMTGRGLSLASLDDLLDLPAYDC